MRVCDICRKRIDTGLHDETIIKLVDVVTGTQYYDLCGKCGRKIKRFIKHQSKCMETQKK